MLYKIIFAIAAVVFLYFAGYAYFLLWIMAHANDGYYTHFTIQTNNLEKVQINLQKFIEQHADNECSASFENGTCKRWDLRFSAKDIVDVEIKSPTRFHDHFLVAIRSSPNYIFYIGPRYKKKTHKELDILVKEKLGDMVSEPRFSER